jgi:ABC-type branched-subunit amino acid transport system ATPase component
VVLVEQYAGEALRRADVAYVLRRGQVAFAGEPGELMTSGHASLFD